MNYSTIKKVVACSLVSAIGFSAYAQNASTTSSSAKLFGGRGQYRTWSIGINAGVLAPVIPFGTNDYNDWNADLGYGAFLKKQLAHSFALKLDFHRGNVSGDYDTNEGRTPLPAGMPASFNTELHSAISLKGVASLGSIDFLKRDNAVNFILESGAGLVNFKPDANDRSELFIPVGLGANFKIGQSLAFNLGYSANFLDADNLDAQWRNGPSNKDKWSYGYAGLEFTLGSSAKPSLEWTNPIALMYDELNDPTLRQEVDALKNRVSALEGQDLLKDSDGDGVADKLDKCPGTPAGTAVDGAGCPIVHPEATAAAVATGGPYQNIQFEFDSSVLRTSAYPILDKVSSDMRANSAMNITLGGHASSEGTDEYNMNLSRDRANSVKTYLVNSGIAASRINTQAFGERQPIASNATEAGRSQNRRVEIR
jgi:OmpA-OmpF porin, OOP family